MFEAEPKQMPLNQELENHEAHGVELIRTYEATKSDTHATSQLADEVRASTVVDVMLRATADDGAVSSEMVEPANSQERSLRLRPAGKYYCKQDT
jgi:hypothetical protein